MKVLWIVCQDLSYYVFLFRRLTLFSFYISSHSKAEKVEFAEWLLLSQSQFHAAELNLRKFNTKSQMKSAPKLVPFSL